MKLARRLNQYTGHLGGLLFLLAFSLFPVVSEAITLPSGFQEQTVFQGLTLPTVVRFAADGRIFVAEKSGKIKIFNGLTDTTPDLLVDLSVNVHDYWDRGLLGMAIDPQFPAKPYIYILYTYDYDPTYVRTSTTTMGRYLPNSTWTNSGRLCCKWPHFKTGSRAKQHIGWN